MAKRKAKVEIYQSENGDHGEPSWRFRVLAGNGEIVASGEGYTSERDAHRGWLTLQLLVLDQPKVEVVDARLIS